MFDDYGIDIQIKNLIERIKWNYENSYYEFPKDDILRIESKRNKLIENIQSDEDKKSMTKNEANMKNFNIFKHPVTRRQRGFNPLIFYESSLNVNENGFAEATILLPNDEIENFSLLAIAATEIQFGVCVANF